MSAIIYIEGGGDHNEKLATQFRRSWKKFFQAADLQGNLPRVVRGGSRDDTFKRFASAVRKPNPKRLPLLLVDSEGAIATGQSVWSHLQTRDEWVRPHGTTEDQAFLMVQAMETWLVADRESFQRYFGEGFNLAALPMWQNLETVPKEDLFESIKKATRRCSTPYAKGKVSFDLLAATAPNQVSAACPHAKRLLDHLAQVV